MINPAYDRPHNFTSAALSPINRKETALAICDGDVLRNRLDHLQKLLGSRTDIIETALEVTTALDTLLKTSENEISDQIKCVTAILLRNRGSLIVDEIFAQITDTQENSIKVSGDMFFLKENVRKMREHTMQSQDDTKTAIDILNDSRPNSPRQRPAEERAKIEL